MSEQRAQRGEARGKIINWCEAFLDEQKRLPTWTEVLAGTGVAGTTLGSTWKHWKAEKEAMLLSANISLGPVIEQVPIPTGISDAWSLAVASVKHTALQEIEADRISTRRELDSLKQASAEKDAVIDYMSSASEEAQDKHESDLAASVADLTRAIADYESGKQTLNRVKQQLSSMKQELAVRNTELAATISSSVLLATQTQKAESVIAAQRSTMDQLERSLTESRITATKLDNELDAVRTLKLILEQQLAASEAKLEATAEQFILCQTDLAASLATAAERQEQLKKADARADKDRERSEVAATKARQQIASLERERDTARNSAAATEQHIVALEQELAAHKHSVNIETSP